MCRRCKRPSCIHPKICPNLNTDHRPLLDIYHAVDALPGIKKSFIGSGVRYDLLLHESKDPAVNKSTQEYTRELIIKHVSGRLKVAPEHTSDKVLYVMRKPPFEQFERFKKIFDRINTEHNLRQQIIPYFISSHPGCTAEDMAELAVITKRLDFHLEQVQDFTPTPMTVATEAWYTGYHPYTLEPIFSAKTQKEKLAQRMFFFWYKPEERKNIINELKTLQEEIKKRVKQTLYLRISLFHSSFIIQLSNPRLHEQNMFHHIQRQIHRPTFRYIQALIKLLQAFRSFVLS